MGEEFDFTCPDCGSEKPPRIEKSIEGADRDGNRGVLVTWAICVECGYSIGDCPF